MSRLIQMLNASDMGYKPDLQWLFSYLERRDAVLKSVKSRRAAAIKKLKWNIKIKEGEDVDQDLAQAQQQFLNQIYNGVSNLYKAIEFLSTAEFRGFAHLEKHYKNSDGTIELLQPVPQHFWVKRYPSADWLYQPRALQSTVGTVIDKNDFIIRNVDNPISEMAAIYIVRKGLSAKDWDSFVETFGIPPIFIELPQGVGLTDEYQAMADKVISNSRGILGNGSKVQTVDAGMRGQTPFKPHIDYQDSQIVLAATGGLLSTLAGATQPVVGGTGEQDANAAIFDEVARLEAIDISETFREWLDIPELKRVFGEDVPILAYFELAHEKVSEKGDIIGDAVRLGSVGLQIDPKQITDQTGYNLARAAQPGMPGAGMGGGYQDAAQLYMNAKKAETKAQCQKIMNAIRKISPNSPDLKKFSACVPEMIG